MISIVYDHKRYHKALAEHIRPEDSVLEIGPHIGGSTKVIAEKAKEVVAVDKAKQSAEALQENPDIAFVKGDVRFFETIDDILKIRKSFDVIAMDMGGGRFPDTVFKVWAVWSGIFKPRDSIIRNRGLGEFLMRAKVEDPVLEKEFVNNGWLTQSGRKHPKQLKEGLEELQHWMKPR